MSSVVLVFLLLVTTAFAVTVGGQPTARGPGPAPVTVPALVQEDLVTADASAFPNTNGWGAMGDRLVRAANGNLYTTYVVDGRGNEHFRWVLAERPAGSTSWQEVAAEPIDRAAGPPSVLLGPSDTVSVVSISPWDGPAAGAPQIWDSRSGRTTSIPGHWLTGTAVRNAGALYPAAAVDALGDIYFWEDIPCPYWKDRERSSAKCQSTNVPGTYYWAYRTPTDGRWHEEWWRSEYRLTYDFLLPGQRGDLSVVGTRDIKQGPAEAPYECPNGSGYCFDQTIMAHWKHRDSSPSDTIIGRAAVDAQGYTGDHRAEADDAYVDTAGRTHVLVGVVDASTHGRYENHQLVIGANGSITDVAYEGVPYPNLSRIVEDTTGKFWIYSVGPGPDGHHCEAFIANATGKDGDQLGPATVMPFAGPWDCASEGRNYDVSVRSGTTRADYIDGVIPTNGGKDWVHYRIVLPSVPSGGPTITSPSSLPDASSDSAYTYRFTASGGQAPYRWSIPAGAAGPPAGISLASDGTLSGTPPAAHATGRIPGSFTFAVQAADVRGRITRSTVQLNVVCRGC